MGTIRLEFHRPKSKSRSKSKSRVSDRSGRKGNHRGSISFLRDEGGTDRVGASSRSMIGELGM
jgi:hypothetical protein